MRTTIAILGLLAALPACSQEQPGKWFLDIHSIKPSLTGHYNGTQDGQPVNFDLQDDLGLAKDGAKPGVSLEYQGHRFGVEFAADEQDYKGSNYTKRKVTISGQNWAAGAQINTTLKVTNYTFNWTVRCLTWDQFWVGLDFGVRGMGLDLKAHGTQPLTAVPADAVFKNTLPIPQLGVAIGFNAFDGRLIGRGFYHGLGYKGASYSHTGADLRYVPLSWLGVRAFVDTESWKVPNGSISSDLEIGLDRTGSGFGVVFRF